MRKVISTTLILVLCILCASFVSCDSEIGTTTTSKAAGNYEQISSATSTVNNGTSSGTSNSTSYKGTISLATSVEAVYPSTYNESDYTQWQSYDFGTEYVFNVDTEEWVGTSPVDAGVATVTLKANKSLKVVNTTDSPISIKLTGSNSSFKVVIEGNGQPVKVTLSDLSISGDYRALNIKDSSVSYVVLEGSNTLVTNVNSEDKNVLKSESNLILDGTGSLSVTANSKNGIVCEQGEICILNGDITVTVAAYTAYTDEETGEVEETKGTAIKAMTGFVILDGNLTIYGNNSDKGYESKGIKVDGYEADEVDESLVGGKGWVVIDGGTITIKTQGKAISAGWKSYGDDADDIPTSTANYPVPDVCINGGTINITTYATPRDDTSTTDGVSPEGIEAKNNLYITGGTLVLNTTDDSLNARKGIYISGGLIYAKASANDAIDAGASESEGYIEISGGVVIALGASQPETGIDCNGNSGFKYTGGIVIALGGAQNNTPQASGTTAYTVSTSGGSAGRTYALVQNNEVVLAFKVPQGYSTGNCLLLGTGSLTQGTATLIGSATVNADSTFNGVLYYGNVSVSGGTSYSVTVSNSAGTQGGFQGGPQSGFQGGNTPPSAPGR